MQPVANSVTIEAIARRAGVHKATVSRALRGLASVRPATRRSIERIARALGYRADPMLSSLAAYRHRRSSAAPIPVMIAHLAETATEHHRPEYSAHPPQAILRLARPLFLSKGYQMAESFFAEHAIPRRIARQWYHTGVQAVIFNTHHATPLPLDDLQAFSLCSLLTEVSPKSTHHIGWDIPGALIQCVDRALDLGAHRIGFALYVDPNHLQKEILVQGIFRHPVLRLKASVSVFPWPNLDLGPTAHRQGAQAFPRWLERFRPEVVITNNGLAGYWSRRVPRRLRPRFIMSERTDPGSDPGWPGTGPDASTIARELVAFVDRLIRTRDRGTPRHPLHLTIPALWSEGTSSSLPRKKRTPARAAAPFVARSASARPGPPRHP